VASCAAVREFTCNGTEAQQYLIGKTFADGSYQLINLKSGMCVDVVNPDASVDGELQQMKCDDTGKTLGQRWTFTRE
jgi:hypothetical protein